ncbi:MAG: CocE/NonD family hydrolase, partial [Oscillospiraceae bacterium]|nr:CocE/NonD family hydrolase [Oscillospiraceae bacterium]
MKTKRMGIRLISLCLTVAMLLSLASVGAFAAGVSDGIEGYEDDAVVTLADLADINSQLGSEDVDDVYTELYEYLYETEGEETTELNMADAVIYTLLYGGLDMSQIVNECTEDDEGTLAEAQTYSFDSNEERVAMYYYNAYCTAENMGILDGIDYDEDAEVTYGELCTMLDNAADLYDVMHSEEVTQLIVDGAAQPIFSYDDIVRFCVYVETNYDTDGDGELDLVKVFIQLPGEAIDLETGEIKMELGSIFEARPYITGCTPYWGSGFTYGEDGWDVPAMYNQPEARTPEAEGTTLDAIAATDEGDYYYYNAAEDMYDYEDLNWYDYYIVRGFAVVECGGLGTLGSDGFETCGTDLEIDAFKCVIEWLHGDSDRVAYTDHDSSYTTVTADWSNGKVGMTGRSYAGTTQFGLATTGVEGLETIVPVAGIASWYEYTNSQGVATGGTSYSAMLALYCAGRLNALESVLGEDAITFISYIENLSEVDYANYLGQIASDEQTLNGDYGVDGVYSSTDASTWYLNHWSSRDYTLDYENIQCSALIVHGLNDTNVKTKQFDLMYDAFEKAGADVKLLLHQGTHLTPTYPSGGYSILVGEDSMSYDELLNLWFCHYLYGIDNGIEDMSTVTVQSNLDGDSWTSYDSWEEYYTYTLDCEDGTDEEESVIDVSSDASSVSYTFAVDDEFTAYGGPIAVHVKAAVSLTDAAKESGASLADYDAVTFSVSVYDTDDTEFDAFVSSRSYLPISDLNEEGSWMGGGLANYRLVQYDMTSTTSKQVAFGYIDLYNPTADYYSYTASTRTELVDGEYYDYTIYLQPNVYTVESGHELQLTLSLSTRSAAAQDLVVTIDNSETYIEIPTTEKISSSTSSLTLSDLANAEELLPEEALTSEEVTWNAAIAYLLRAAGMEESQLGTYPDDYAAMADSLAMIDLDDYDGTAVITVAEYEALSADEGLAALTAAMSAETKSPLFVNGMAQPIFPYTTGSVLEGYSNEDIIRFCVYVETDWDTDNDGYKDLVKALVQLPRAAAEGDFEAATIYEARPYITGCTDRSMEYNDDELDYDVYNNPAKEERAEATAVIDSWETSEEFVNAADSSDWYYWNAYESMYDYEDLEWYDYYLVRGYAVVECGGLGTRGSEGFETCGSNMEIEAFKCVIEWLHGTEGRVAYTDKDATTEIEAYWSNGKVGMTGRSYAGTTQFGLATTGVEGLETIVPVAGISSWYEYTNAQGISTRSSVAYTNTLAAYCAGRYLDSYYGQEKGIVDADVDDWESIADTYGSFLQQMADEQTALNGDYGDHWAIRDYTLDAENIQCSALIVHGLNDYNVRTKMFDQMYQAFTTAGQNVKLLLHQDGHLTPTYPAGNLVFNIGDSTYDEILNRWFSHYLYDVDNGAEDMAAVTAQDSHSNTWSTYDSWETAKYEALTADSTGTTTISSDYSLVGADMSSSWWGYMFDWEDALTAGSTDVSVMYTTDVTETFTVKGSVAVNFSATASNTEDAGEDAVAIEDRDALMVSAMLVDIAPEGETFPVFNTSGSYVPKTTLKEAGAWMGGGLANYDLTIHNTTDVSYKIVTRGWMDLANPDAGYDSASATRENKVTLGDEYDYTLYLMPTIYEVEEGHTLALVIYTYEPSPAHYAQNYLITIDNASVDAEIPVDGETEGPAVNVTTSVSNKTITINVTSDETADFTIVLTDEDGDVVDTQTVSGTSESVKFTGLTNGDKYTVTVTAVTSDGGETTVTKTATPKSTSGGGSSGSSSGSSIGGSTTTTTTGTFTDVSTDTYYYDAVEWAVANGITTGTSDTTFSPEIGCSRA